MTFGKVMGGGLPAAAFGGRADIMARLAPAGPVYQAGTLSGNPLACAAGLATLRSCTDEVYARVDDGRRCRGQARLRRAGRRRGAVPAVRSAGSLFSVFFAGRRRCVDFADAQRPVAPRPTPRSSTPCSTGGVYLPPSPYEAWFLSAAHDDAALARIADALPPAACAAAAALGAYRAFQSALPPG